MSVSTPHLPDIDSLGDLTGRVVLVRSDLNVPLDQTGETPQITDDGRIRASVPTIRALADAGARVVVLAHLGRPKGAPDLRYSLASVAARLGELLGAPVAFAPTTVGPPAATVVGSLADGQVAVCENVRFDPRETSKDDSERMSLALELASLGGVDAAYVSDGFGAVHRAHASVYDLPKVLPHAAGLLVREEVDVLRRLTDDPRRPYVVVLGGAKVSDKLGVIDNLLGVADRLLIGGGMAFTFLAAQGHEIGRSLVEPDQLSTVTDYLTKAGSRIVLPTDVVAATAVEPDAPHDVVGLDAIGSDRMGLDIGPDTVRRFGEAIAGARTVFWNGPMGVFEIPAFADGTRGVAEAIADVSGLTVVGGGDSAAAIRRLGIDEQRFGHISTGGGASLEYLEGEPLPGLAVLSE